MKTFYAKSNPEESLEEHTSNALKQYELLKKYYPKILNDTQWEMLKYAVIYHDLGKLDENFQKSIKYAMGIDKERAECMPHNFLSCALIDAEQMLEKFGEENMITIFRAIIFHHNRLPPDWDSEEGEQNLRQYINENVIDNAKQYNFMGYSLPNHLSYEYLDYLTFKRGEELSSSYIKVKGFLNRADYCASAGINIEDNPPSDSSNICIYTQKFMERKNYPPRKLQKYMLDNSDKNIVVTAATGSGKTEGSLLWIGKSKAFYTLPLKISINAIYERITDIEGIGYSPAVLLHSEALSYYLANDENDDLYGNPSEKYMKAKMLSAPLTVCTIDQILKGAYKFNGSELYFSTLSYSKLIIDEIQTYSPDLLGTILYALKRITELGGTFAIVTATFPKLLKKLFMDEKIDCEFSPQFYGNVRARHRMTLIESKDFDIDKILKDAETKKVLIIVNTVSHAQKLYETLREYSQCRLLHSMFLKKDRAELEKMILAFAPNTEKNGECGIWISTQIVEASLDIDFDVLYTEMCTIDSLLQRMGRVYRSREYTLEEPNVYILDNRNGVIKNGEFINPEIYDWSLEAVKNQLSGKASVLLYENEECDLKKKMIDSVYDEKHSDSKYYRDIKTRFKYLRDLECYKLTKKDADKYFREIDSVTICPHEVYEFLEECGKTAQWKDALKCAVSLEQKRKIKDEISGYTINISFYHGLDYTEKDLFYKHSGIYLYNGSYDFCESDCCGKGMIKQYVNNRKYSVEELII